MKKKFIYFISIFIISSLYELLGDCFYLKFGTSVFIGTQTLTKTFSIKYVWKIAFVEFFSDFLQNITNDNILAYRIFMTFGYPQYGVDCEKTEKLHL